MEEESESWPRTLAKYFFHGVLYSVIWLVLIFVWAIATAMLVGFGFIIGLIIGLIILLYFIGGVNSIVTSLIWGTSVRTEWKCLLAHGFVLGAALAIAGIPNLIITNFYAPSLTTLILLFIVYCFIDGFIGRNVASFWEESPDEEE